MSNDLLLEKLNTLIKPIVDELCFELYYLEFVKENNENYLRIYIDKESDRISLNDCETVSRRVSDMLDIEDPIQDPYYLEVSSPGINRTLFTDSHFEKAVGSKIAVKLNGNKVFKGILKNINNTEIVIEKDGEDISISKHKIKHANLEGEI